MQELSTHQRKNGIFSVILAAFLSFSMINTVSAQTYCANETVFWSENFGTGTAYSSSPDVINLTYNGAFVGLNDGYYRISDNTWHRPEWHNTVDHTPSDVNGKMLVVNGQSEEFYQKEISNGTTGFAVGTYAASLFLINVNPPGVCAPNPLLPSITFIVEYNTAATGGTWVPLQTVSSNNVPQTATPTWIQLGGVFNLPAPAQRFRLTLSNGTNSGCGNDFAIDDLMFATCPEGGPMPVEFLNISAAQKGSGVSVNWATASEINNEYFDVEKSIDGSNWATVTRVRGAGNSNVVKNYNAYDAKPVAGYNFYRIKQVDIDGKFKYSSVVKVKISIDKVGVTVMGNPFVNVITVDFLSNKSEAVTLKLTDLSGRTVAMDRWQISKGASRKVFDKSSALQRGMYIFTVTGENGEVIYNNKLMKQ